VPDQGPSDEWQRWHVTLDRRSNGRPYFTTALSERSEGFQQYALLVDRLGEHWNLWHQVQPPDDFDRLVYLDPVEQGKPRSIDVEGLALDLAAAMGCFEVGGRFFGDVGAVAGLVAGVVWSHRIKPDDAP
jgi:hypothetical protein